MLSAAVPACALSLTTLSSRGVIQSPPIVTSLNDIFFEASHRAKPDSGLVRAAFYVKLNNLHVYDHIYYSFVRFEVKIILIDFSRR